MGNHLMFFKWESEEAFEAWHKNVKSGLGIPYANKNAATGEIDENASWTTSYTTLKADDNGVKFAKVEDKIAQQFSEGLGEPHEPYYDPEEII